VKRCLIDINDAGIRISDAGGLVRVSPGFAFLHQGVLLTGEQAAARIRTNPRAGNDRFWHQLSQSPLPRSLGPARTHADLAWYHLRELWTPLAEDYDEVLLSVSGDYDVERLSTLLGIARACDMPVRSVVAAAVAAAASHWQHDDAIDAADLVCIDAQWHRLVLEPLQVQAGRVSINTTDPQQQGDVVRHGMAALFDRWAHTIAETFLQRTRFDPLHNAASEQQLFDALPGWLQQLSSQQQIQVQLRAGGHDFSIDMDREQFSAAAADLYAPLLQLASIQRQPLLLRQRLLMLPGLVQALQQHAEVRIVADDQISSFLLQSAAALISDDVEEVRHHLSLALAADAGRGQDRAAASTAHLPPTHISDGESLWRLGHEGIVLPPPAPGRIERSDGLRLQRHSDGHVSVQTAAAGQSAAALQINDLPISTTAASRPQQLAAGDRLSVDGQQYLLLRLVQ